MVDTNVMQSPATQNKFMVQGHEYEGDVMPEGTPAYVTWGELNQTHPDFCEREIKKRLLLLNGHYKGKSISDPEYAQLFCPRWSKETDDQYKDRLSFAGCYENNFGHIVNGIFTQLCSKQLTILPPQDSIDGDTPGEEPDPESPYMKLQSAFTLDRKQTLVQFFKKVAIESNVLGISWYGVDFDDGDPDKPYGYHIDPLSVLDWEFDDDGNLVFLVIRNDSSPRTGVGQSRNRITSTFIEFKKDEQLPLVDTKTTIETGLPDDDMGKVYFNVYQIQYDRNQPPDEKQKVKRIITKSPVDFKQIPIPQYRTPDNMSLGNLISNLASSIYMRTVTYHYCLNRGINPILAYFQEPEYTEAGDAETMSEILDDPDRGVKNLNNAQVHGKALLSNNEKLEYVQTNAAAYTIASEQIDKDKNEMYRLASMLSDIISKGGISSQQTKSSGLSKILDNKEKENFLACLADLFKCNAIEAYNLIFEAMPEPADVKWDANGMDKYSVIDEDSLQAKIAVLPEYKTNMPSETSYIEVLIDTANDMHPDATIGVMNKIRKEIVTNVRAQGLKDIHQEANTTGALEADTAGKVNDAAPKPLKPGNGG